MRGLLLVVLVASDVVVVPDGVLPAGTRLVARMNTTIGTTRSLGVDRIADETRAGAPFAATVETTVVDADGRTRLAAGAIVHGHVARLERGEGGRRAVLELAVDRLDREPIAARVVASEVQQLDNADVGGEVDATTFWGMVFGGIAFGIPGVAIGHGMAGGLGAVNAVRARTVEAWLAAGSLISVELEEPLRLGALSFKRRGGRQLASVGAVDSFDVRGAHRHRRRLLGAAGGAGGADAAGAAGRGRVADARRRRRRSRLAARRHRRPRLAVDGLPAAGRAHRR